MGNIVMKLLNQAPLNYLVEQEPRCGAPLSAWRQTINEGTWQDIGQMRKDLALTLGEAPNEIEFFVARDICHLKALVVFRRQIVLVTDARLVRALNRRVA